jgi:ribose transport system substrate-binding protein
MRKTWTIAGASLAMIAFAGAPAKGDDKLKIGFSQGTMESAWRVNMVEGNKKFAEANLPDVELIVTNGENNASKQVSDVESLIAQGVKTLIISPVTADALTPVVKQAMDAGIPVVTLDRKVNTDVTLHIGADNKLIGKTAGEFVCKALGGKGNVIEIQGTAGASATIDRHDEFHKVLAEQCPDVKVVADQVCNYVREPAIKFMEDMLQRFKPGEIQLVYAHNDDMALGAVTALEAAGRLRWRPSPTTSSRRKASSTAIRSPRAKSSTRRSSCPPTRSIRAMSTSGWARDSDSTAAGCGR